MFTSRKFVSSHYHILYYEKPGGRRTFNLQSRYSTNEVSDEGGSSNYSDREDVFRIKREYKPGQEKIKTSFRKSCLKNYFSILVTKAILSATFLWEAALPPS